MKGFVTKKPSRTDKELTCLACGLYKQCTTPRMPPYGNFKRGIMNIGEAPGEVEDRVGKPWQGKTGQLLQRTYQDLGVDLFEDCININAVRCRPTDKGRNRTPKNSEINCCRRFVLRNIAEYKPKMIVLLGNTAVTSLIGYRWKRDLGTITKWRGWTIPDQDFKAWICPTFHPSYVERAIGERELEAYTVWEQDLARIIEQENTPFTEYTLPVIDVLGSETLHLLEEIKGGDIAIDYETTGLKPHAEGHRIICASVANAKDHVFVFMMPKTKQERLPFINLIKNVNIGKIAHNMKFEDTWSRVRLQQSVVNWTWDCMLAAHVLDNRRGVTSLKFQTYVNFGIVDYASEVENYLKPKGVGSSNTINQIPTLLSQPQGEEKLLKYCALDAIYEYRLASKQRNMILPF